MQNSFFQAICRIGIFMICVRALIHFRPNESYEKYLRLLAGILIMIQLFLPVGRLFLGKGGQEAAQMLQEFRQELERGMEEATESAAAADALLEQMTLEEIQRRLEEQASQEEAEDGNTYPEDRGAGPEDGNASLKDREINASSENVNTNFGKAEPEDEGGNGITVRVEEIEPVYIRNVGK